jgi:hypothetical protein
MNLYNGFCFYIQNKFTTIFCTIHRNCNDVFLISAHCFPPVAAVAVAAASSDSPLLFAPPIALLTLSPPLSVVSGLLGEPVLSW